ncbi:hypothetical protein NGB36_25045 [Streptomyces sp. RB6PN25]|uniref:Major facilitator superfamily (MFS) profile domain-containing protein n=1 Tax=Streptomyces humicola TaxID=2953240 RepID=A0ABT1Q362_9ACTN|nr:hypothetical protein [Streptomyces humicola]MCQ4083770.1 hypothetical protein [Streptomyces humicola]
MLVVTCVGYFLLLPDVTIVNVALPRIGTGLAAGVSGLQWRADLLEPCMATTGR